MGGTVFHSGRSLKTLDLGGVENKGKRKEQEGSVLCHIGSYLMDGPVNCIRRAPRVRVQCHKNPLKVRSFDMHPKYTSQHKKKRTTAKNVGKYLKANGIINCSRYRNVIE